MAAAPAVVQALASPRTARSAGSVVEAATRVLPVASSTSWAPMWRRLRNTASRGRAAGPETGLGGGRGGGGRGGGRCGGGGGTPGAADAQPFRTRACARGGGVERGRRVDRAS